jgi:hypothetical protein
MVTLNGGISPGASPAAVVFDGDVALGTANQLEIELGGTSLGSEYDSLQIAGEANLDGALRVSLIDGFVPEWGDRFEVLHAEGGIFNEFDSISLPGLAAALEWDVVYSNFKVLLLVESTLPGDYNHNGVVDAADYIVWRDSLGVTGGQLPADGDGDGIITATDYTVWRSNFGRTAASNARASTDTIDPSHSVPEPVAVILLVSAVGTIAPSWRNRSGRRHHRRSRR